VDFYYLFIDMFGLAGTAGNGAGTVGNGAGAVKDIYNRFYLPAAFDCLSCLHYHAL